MFPSSLQTVPLGTADGRARRSRRWIVRASPPLIPRVYDASPVAGGHRSRAMPAHSVLHTALRAARCDKILDMDGTDVVPEVFPAGTQKSPSVQ